MNRHDKWIFPNFISILSHLKLSSINHQGMLIPTHSKWYHPLSLLTYDPYDYQYSSLFYDAPIALRLYIP
jgi:hypothetical protein